MSYEYEKTDSSNQYAGMPIEGTVVKARYLPSDLKSERGRRLIEALPLPRIEITDWQIAYSMPLTEYKWDPGKPKRQKLREIWQLRNVRFPLPFDGEIEREFYRSLTDSYSSRYLTDEEASGDIFVNNRNIRQYGRMRPEKNGAVVGFSLLGSSQSGKTSALKILTSWYPQVIEHQLDNGGKFIQIVYLDVECQIHSSMKSMFDAIGHEIDKALGNTAEIYEELFRKGRQTIAQKEQILRKLIDTFGIGALILEECQCMNFNSQDEKSFEAFLTLCNETGVALIMVGTEDARKKMFGYAARTAHRVGPQIRSDMYCGNTKFLTVLIQRLFRYQWFDEEITLTAEMAEALINHSHGIIGLLVRIYMFMNEDYITAVKKPVVDAKYVETTAKRHFSEIIKLLERAGNSNTDEEYKKAFQKLDDSFDEIIKSEEIQEENAKSLSSSGKELEDYESLKSFLVERCMDDQDYEPSFLSRIIEQAWKEGILTGVSKRESYRRLRERLREAERQKKKKSSSNQEIDWSQEVADSAPDDPFGKQ